jgi:hypothetical protein
VIWVAAEILSKSFRTVQDRANAIQFFIDVAAYCHTFNNFSGLFSIIFGLTQPAVKQLSTAWGLVETSKIDQLHALQQVCRNTNIFVLIYCSMLLYVLCVSVKPRVQEVMLILPMMCPLVQITSDSKNYEVYREKIKKCVLQPVIPLVSLMLRDMWQLDTSPKSKVQNGLVNFEKFRKIHSRISTFLSYKDHSYTRGFVKTPSARMSGSERPSSSSASNWGKNLKKRKIIMKHDTEIQKLICCRRIRLRKKGSKLWELGKKINNRDSKKFVSNLNAAGFL